MKFNDFSTNSAVMININMRCIEMQEFEQSQLWGDD